MTVIETLLAERLKQVDPRRRSDLTFVAIVRDDENDFRNDLEAVFAELEQSEFEILNSFDELGADSDSSNRVIVVSPYAAASDFSLLRSFIEANGNLDDCSGIALIEMPGSNRPILLSDVVLHSAPSKEIQVSTINNCIDLATKLGIDRPNVAVLAAVEVVNPGMPVTVEAEAIASEFSNVHANVQGPLSMDVAVNELAASKKNVPGEVPGKANCLVGPDVSVSRNMLLATVHGAGVTPGIIVNGLNQAIVLPLRGSGRSGLKLSILLALVSK